MKSEAGLSFLNISHLIKQYWIYNSKLIFMALFGLAGGLFVLLYSIQIITRFDAWTYEHFMYIFIGTFIVMAVLYSGSSFPGLRSNVKGVHYLLLPATGAFALGDQEIVRSAADSRDHSTTLLYFSFVTITTLGYGDVRPQAEIAQMLAVGEAVIGQLYLTIFVARLIACYVGRERDGSR